MRKRKLTVESLEELAKKMPVLSEIQQKTFVGRGDGSSINPYTLLEFEAMCASGTWTGGYVDGWGYTSEGKTTTGSSGSEYGGSNRYPGKGSLDCVIQSVAYMYGLSVDEVHAKMSQVLQDLYGFGAAASDVMAGLTANREQTETLIQKIAGDCYVNSYNGSNASMCALGLARGSSGLGHAVVLEFYDASTNSYHYVDPQNNNITGTITAEDLDWIITGGY